MRYISTEAVVFEKSVVNPHNMKLSSSISTGYAHNTKIHFIFPASFKEIKQSSTFNSPYINSSIVIVALFRRKKYTL